MDTEGFLELVARELNDFRMYGHRRATWAGSWWINFFI